MNLEKRPKIKYAFVSDNENEMPLGMDIELKTTGFLGGDNSETYIKLKPNSCFGVNYQLVDINLVKNGWIDGINFRIKGDWELQDTIDSLKWLVNKLEYVQQETKK